MRTEGDLPSQQTDPLPRRVNGGEAFSLFARSLYLFNSRKYERLLSIDHNQDVA